MICLTGCGDLEYLRYKFKSNKNVIFDDFSYLSKDLVNLYFLTEVDFVVANMGGALFCLDLKKCSNNCSKFIST